MAHQSYINEHFTVQKKNFFLFIFLILVLDFSAWTDKKASS